MPSISLLDFQQIHGHNLMERKTGQSVFKIIYMTNMIRAQVEINIQEEEMAIFIN